MRSALYCGHVVHTRLRPKRHRLRYRVFSLLVDVDEAAALSRRLRLFGHNRRALFSLHDADHGDGHATLKDWALAQLAEAGIELAQPRIELLCYPRMFGYVFNPLSVYFCHDGQKLRAIVYEVHNTFGERHAYVIGVTGEGAVEQACAKQMHVSPFVPMACEYRFHIEPPDDGVLLRVADYDAAGPLLVASFAGRRRELSDAALLRALFAYPLMTLKVTAAIHWEAAKLWLKGLQVIRHVPAPERVTTSVETAGGTAPAHRRDETPAL